MLTVYHSNQLAFHKEMLIHHLKQQVNSDPFKKETILVQSVGMAQWLQMEIASELGIAGNLEFPFPTSFLWQQYRALFPELPEENVFNKSAMIWRLMRLLPSCLSQPEFIDLKHYLNESHDQVKLYQLAAKIADLFDQYLVYRPEWLSLWETNNLLAVENEISRNEFISAVEKEEAKKSIKWQSVLWNLVVEEIKQSSNELVFNTSHRAYLQEQYFEKLDRLSEEETALLPQRIFIFGISSFPYMQLATLNKLSRHIDIHLFFLNPSQEFWWGNNQILNVEEHQNDNNASDIVINTNPLLTLWGKQGKDLLSLLYDFGPNEIEAYQAYDSLEPPVLLSQIKNSILNSANLTAFNYHHSDNSIQFHSCHSEMREVEVLHNQLLHLLEKDQALLPNDIIVMSTDIDKYKPYIEAVFSRYDLKDSRFIPYSISDQKVVNIDPIISSFLFLLKIREEKLSAEYVLNLIETLPIKEKLGLADEDLDSLRKWIGKSGIRFGLYSDEEHWNNYNSWENGLNRLLLGSALKEENGIWENTLSFDESYGLNAELIGILNDFLLQIVDWYEFAKDSYCSEDWKKTLNDLIFSLYPDSEDYSTSQMLLQKTMDNVFKSIEQANFDDRLDIDIIAQVLENSLNEQRNSLNFLVGKVNFCNLLPMRAIPFKVVCLLGMNEEDFPKKQMTNSFDLMQLSPRKGDRARREDDRYLFLESLLSAQDILYISYIGRSIQSNEERLPSILVNQLQDFIRSNLSEQEWLAFNKANLIQHSLSSLSKDEFMLDSGSYYNEIVHILNGDKGKFNDFLVNADYGDKQVEQISTVEIESLIKFVQDPIRYFFNHKLGIYFSENDEVIDEAENFELDALQNYKLLDKALLVENKQYNDYFLQEKLKGNLLSGSFSEIIENEISAKITDLAEALSPYLSQQPEKLSVNLYCLDNVKLIGKLNHQFNDKIILWKVSSIKDKDIILLWIYHLVTIVMKSDISCEYIYTDDKKVRKVYFERVEYDIAKTMLETYISEYVNFDIYNALVINFDIKKYINNIEKEKDIGESEYCRGFISDILEKEYGTTYLSRVISQSKNINFTKIHHKTLAWFEMMLSNLKEEKI